MTYGRRAAGILSGLKYNALVYIMPDREDQSDVKDDWLADMFSEVAGVMRSSFTGSLTFITPYNDLRLPKDIAQISLLTEASKDKLPAIYLMHTKTENVL